MATLDIDGDGKGAEISDTMFGIFYEDINYAADGGLYAELVRNRSFEFNSTDNGGFTGLTGWQVLNRSGAGTDRHRRQRRRAAQRDEPQLPARSWPARPATACATSASTTASRSKAGEKYDASVWARSPPPRRT